MKLNYKALFMEIYVLLLMLHLQHDYWVCGKPQVPCYFIFGGSVSDNGNNNNLPTLSKANFQPYGIDFPEGATGRFTNGRNLVDFIAEYLGFENYIPPFAKAKGREIIQGVNYASGGGGIRDETGRFLGAIASMNDQLKNHQATISRINGIMRSNKSTAAYLRKCIYSVEIGTNDYQANYFSSLYPTSSLYTPQQYATLLIQQLSHQLENLYVQGARKVAMIGVRPIGCTPNARANFNTNGSQCVDNINNAVQLFNLQLKALVDDLNTKLMGAKFIFIDIFEISSIASSSPDFVVSDAPCCEVEPGQVRCIPSRTPCGNRTQYLYWDVVHSTEALYMAIARRSYQAQSPLHVHPYDISHLAKL